MDSLDIAATVANYIKLGLVDENINKINTNVITNE
jgi:hypothetical protein